MSRSAACLAALVEDLAAAGEDLRLVIERDDSLLDVAAWCWARSGERRRRIEPILTAARTV